MNCPELLWTGADWAELDVLDRFEQLETGLSLMAANNARTEQT